MDDTWPDRWREFHHAIRIGPLWVGPPWEEAPPSALAVVIDPGRAFGTGAHPTTRLCLELLQVLEPAALLDVGCGSGVLSIAAAKLGFATVVAVDVDEVAVEVARANAVANGVELEARRLDVLTEPLPPAGLAVANISLELVEASAPAIDAGRLITAGYLAADRPQLPGYTSVRRAERDGWAADLFTRAR